MNIGPEHLPLVWTGITTVFAIGAAWATMRSGLRAFDERHKALSAEIAEDFANMREEVEDVMQRVETVERDHRQGADALHQRVSAHDIHLGVITERLAGVQAGQTALNAEVARRFDRLEARLFKGSAE